MDLAAKVMQYPSWVKGSNILPKDEGQRPEPFNTFAILELKGFASMDIQTRKFNFIQEFLKVEDEDLIALLESLLHANSSAFNPMTIEQFHQRMDASIEDSIHDRVVSSTDLLSEIEKWA